MNCSTFTSGFLADCELLVVTVGSITGGDETVVQGSMPVLSIVEGFNVQG